MLFFCVMLHLLCFDVYFYYVLHNCNNHKQALNQLHAHAYNIMLFKNKELGRQDLLLFPSQGWGEKFGPRASPKCCCIIWSLVIQLCDLI